MVIVLPESTQCLLFQSGIERMLMHYVRGGAHCELGCTRAENGPFLFLQVPEVKGVEQIISAEESIAADEFAKFEARLRGEGKTVTI